MEEKKIIIADDMILTVGIPTTAGSKMLDGYNSLFEAEVLTRLNAAGYQLGGKADVGEFASNANPARPVRQNHAFAELPIIRYSLVSRSI